MNRRPLQGQIGRLGPITGLTFLIALGARPADAQQVEEPNRLRLELTPYFWSYGISGTVTVDGRATEVDRDVGDILKFTDIGASLQIELREKSWGFVLNGQYLEPEDSSEVRQMTARELILDGFLAYRAVGRLDVLVGGRYFIVEAKSREPGRPEGSRDLDWVDLMIGARYSWDISSRWSFRGRAAVGGSPSGSDHGWSLSAALHYRLLPQASLGLAYRALQAEYEEGTVVDRFLYDLTRSGLGLGVRFVVE